MASTADTLLDGIEFSERVAGDLAHTAPVFKFFISRTSAAKLLEMVDQVQEHLNEAGDILNDTDSKEALYQVGLYQGLLDELVKYAVLSPSRNMLLIYRVMTQEKLDAAEARRRSQGSEVLQHRGEIHSLCPRRQREADSAQVQDQGLGKMRLVYDIPCDAEHVPRASLRSLNLDSKVQTVTQFLRLYRLRPRHCLNSCMLHRP